MVSQSYPADGNDLEEAKREIEKEAKEIDTTLKRILTRLDHLADVVNVVASDKSLTQEDKPDLHKYTDTMLEITWKIEDMLEDVGGVIWALQGEERCKNCKRMKSCPTVTTQGN